MIFLDQDDVLDFRALECFDHIDLASGAAYSDHAVISESGIIIDTFRKPAWSPVLAHQVMYFGHVKCFDTRTLRTHYTNNLPDLTSDHSAMLAIGLSGYKIKHIPLVLAGWRSVDTSLAHSSLTKPEVVMNFERSISLINPSETLNFNNLHGPFNHILTPTVRADFVAPSLDVIIPTRWTEKYAIFLLQQLLPIVKENLIKIILVDTNPSSRPPEFEGIQKLFGDKLTTITWREKFNYSAVNNFAVKNGVSDHILFLNDDTKLLTYDAFRKMQAMLLFPGVAAVGAKLLYRDGKVQHGGVAIGLRGTSDHMYRNWDYFDSSAHNSLQWNREVSAVTAACLLMRRKHFEELSGFDESFEIAYQDLDLCLKALERFGSIIQMQTVFLLHFESVSRGSEYSFSDRSQILSRWKTNVAQDPFKISSSLISSNTVK